MPGRRVLAGLRRCGMAVVTYVAGVGIFYRDHLRAFTEYLTEFAPGLQPISVRRRELRLSVYQRFRNALRTEDGWHVELPDCCAVCGRPTDREWITGAYPVLDVALPFWSPIAGLGMGFVLMVATWWFWMWPLGLLAGFIFGYEDRRKESAVLRFRRCEEHSDVTSIPHLRRFKELLIVRVGHQRVRRLFFRGNEGGESYQAAMEPPASELPRMRVEEADEGTSIEPDERPRMAGYPGRAENVALRGASDAAPAESPSANDKLPHPFESDNELKTNEHPVWGTTMPLAGDEDDEESDAQNSDEKEAT